MADLSGLRLESVSMVGAKKLRNGGMVYELCSIAVAKWLRGEWEAFIVSFGGTLVVKDRCVAVIIEYVPILH